MATLSRFRWRYLWLALLALLLVLVLHGCAHYARQQLYLPGSGPVTPPQWEVTPPGTIFATTSDGLRLPGYYWPAIAPQRDIVMVLHGRRDNRARMARYVEHLHDSGLGVLVASYRGYNENPGSPTEAGLIEDARAFYRFARERAGPNGRVYVFGHSLGGAVAIQLAAREPLDGVITLGAFTDVGEVAPFYADPFIPDDWNSRETLAQVDEPLLFLHGAEDTYVTPDQSRALYAATCSLTALAIIDGVRHKPNFHMIRPFIASWIDALERGGFADLRVVIPGTASWQAKAACAR